MSTIINAFLCNFSTLLSGWFHTSGYDEVNSVLLLASRAGKMGLSCTFEISHLGPAKGEFPAVIFSVSISTDKSTGMMFFYVLFCLCFSRF